MSIEVRQMVVKSNVVQACGRNEEKGRRNAEEERKAILDECRRLIIEAMREMKER